MSRLWQWQQMMAASALLMATALVAQVAPPTVAETRPVARPTLSADQPLEFDGTTQSLLARGEATFAHEQVTIVADEIRYFQREERAEARGNVRITHEGFRYVGTSVTYEVKSRTIRSEGFLLGTPPFFAEGVGFSGATDAVAVEDARVTYGEPDALSPTIAARQVTINPNDRSVRAQGVALRIGSVPILYVPNFSFGQGEAPLQLNLRTGVSGSLGGRLGATVEVPVAPGLGIGAEVDIFAKRGVMVGPAFTWQRTTDAWSTRTRLRSGWIADQKDDRGDDVFGETVPAQRWFGHLRSSTNFGDNFTLQAALDPWSDTEVLRDFRNRLFRGLPEPENWVEGVYRSGPWYVSAATRFRVAENVGIPERLPEIRFDLTSTPLPGPTGLYHSGWVSAGRFEADDVVGGGDSLDNTRVDALYTLRRPVRLAKWLNAVPVASIRGTYYSDGVGAANGDGVTRWMGEVGLDLDAIAHATWDWQPYPVWGIQGLRHIVRPVARYRWLPGGGDERANIPQIERAVFTTGVPPIGLADLRHPDDLSDAHILRFGFESVWQTRHQDYGARDLLRFDLYQDVRFDTAPGVDQWEAIHALAQFDPAPWLAVGWYHQFAPEALEVRENRLYVTLRDAQLWSLSLAADLIDDRFNQYAAIFRYRFDDRWTGRAQVRWDEKTETFFEQRYAVVHRLGNAWELELEVALSEGDVREGDDEIGVSLSISLVEF